MNEGAIATAAAVHVAAAVAPRFRELYGADGLVDDPASGLSYEDGRVRIADGRGLGIAFDPSGTRIIEEYDA
jgi:L-alanine-DL-glutamate epimerase-like enolase superfamily enzyme